MKRPADNAECTPTPVDRRIFLQLMELVSSSIGKERWRLLRESKFTERWQKFLDTSMEMIALQGEIGLISAALFSVESSIKRTAADWVDEHYHGLWIEPCGANPNLCSWQSVLDPPYHDDEEEICRLESIAYLPVKRQVVGVGSGGVWLWDKATGQTLGFIDGNPMLGCKCLAISPSERLVAVSECKRDIGIYDLQDMTMKKVLCGSDEVKSFIFLSEQRGVSGDGCELYLWDLVSGTILQSLDVPARSFSFDHEQQKLAVIGGSGFVGLYNLNKSLYEIWTSKVKKKSPSGTSGLTERQKQKIGIVWDRPSATMDVVALLNSSEKIITGGWDYVLRFWDADRGKCSKILDGHHFWIDSMAVSPDGTRVITGSSDCTVRAWDLENMSPIGFLRTSEPVEALSFCNNSTFLTLERGSTIRQWGIDSFQEEPIKKTVADKPARKVTVDSRGTKRKVFLHGKFFTEIDALQAIHLICDIDPNENLIYVIEDGSHLRVWNIKAGKWVFNWWIYKEFEDIRVDKEGTIHLEDLDGNVLRCRLRQKKKGSSLR